jgi:hypothetical protein
MLRLTVGEIEGLDKDPKIFPKQQQALIKLRLMSSFPPAGGKEPVGTAPASPDPYCAGILFVSSFSRLNLNFDIFFHFLNFL